MHGVGAGPAQVRSPRGVWLVFTHRNPGHWENMDQRVPDPQLIVCLLLGAGVGGSGKNGRQMWPKCPLLKETTDPAMILHSF